ncbi:MAG: hypothetical protein ACLTDF_09180 [Coprococcus sp.]
MAELLDGMNRYVTEPRRRDEFGARVFKIGRDDKGEADLYEDHWGTLRLKDVLTLTGRQGEETLER